MATQLQAKGVHLFDLASVEDVAINDYRSEGFTNNTDDCHGVADCSTYVFWDTIHPTAKAHQLIASKFEQALNSTYDGSKK